MKQRTQTTMNVECDAMCAAHPLNPLRPFFFLGAFALAVVVPAERS